MTSALVMRSYPNSSHAPGPYSTSTPRATSISVAQARSHRLAEQDQPWSTPQTQGVSDTFAEDSVAFSFGYGSPLDDSCTDNGSGAAHYNDTSFPPTFASPSTPQDHPPSHSQSQNSPRSARSYSSAESYHSPQYLTSSAGNTTVSSNSFSNPYPQMTPYARTAEIPSEPSHTNASLTSMQPHYPTTQFQPDFDEQYSTTFGGACHSNGVLEPAHFEGLNTLRVQPAYNDQPSCYPAYDDRRGSVAGTFPGHFPGHRTSEPQINSNNNCNRQAEQRPSAASPSYGVPPTAHIPSPFQAPPIQELTSLQRHEAGSTKSVEQTKHPQTRAHPSKGRRDKLTPTSDGSEESEDLLTKYKVAYERTRLQRDFYERAASSLVYQVDVLGGDPMQASRQASKGEDLDPKNARLYSLRQPCNGPSRNMSSGYFLEEDGDKSPLSAAPVTVYTHHRK
ncbi:hypothetical protein BN14_01387 [Rhizoctonia solani AG-1 IB]|uniref:Uncharacterized protein n=1 Tax=Thanatephorus cucumeris (strain AG1-IB / isolate 7/3/14) TaxID=1108050 RepID=M5BKR5_THACB|nr:hypothetical protein BN14_01387 [Rhizoctonia solani AG-1 IB]